MQSQELLNEIIDKYYLKNNLVQIFSIQDCVKEPPLIWIYETPSGYSLVFWTEPTLPCRWDLRAPTVSSASKEISNFFLLKTTLNSIFSEREYIKYFFKLRGGGHWKVFFFAWGHADYLHNIAVLKYQLTLLATTISTKISTLRWNLCRN